MHYLTERSFKKKAMYLTTFLPIALISYVTTISSANAIPDERWEEPLAVEVDRTIFRNDRVTGDMPIKGVGDSDELAQTDWIMMDPPKPSPTVTFYDPDARVEVTRFWGSLKNSQILRLLSNTTTEITIGKVEASGKVTYLLASATGEVGTYIVIMDFIPYRTETALDKLTKKNLGEAKIGVGLRLTAKITTNTANIDLGSPMALGAAANLKQLQGTMRVDSIGIRLKDDSGIMLSSTKIDESGILKVLQTLAVVQSKIADETTYLEPHIISVKPSSYKYEPIEVVKSIENRPITPPKKPTLWERLGLRPR